LTAVLATLLSATLSLVAAPPAGASDNGPRLSVNAERLDNSLNCYGNDLDESNGAPVLLIHGTFVNASVNWDWNYRPGLIRTGRAVCTVSLPGNGMGDIQIAAQYVVHAIRAMNHLAHRRIDLIGFSQGGMIGRWALKYWPDTRDAVDDYVSIDGSNHGTLDAHAVCATGCAPAVWQQRSGSHFLRALNSGGETFAGISYTQVFTVTDEVVVPNLPPAASTSLHTGQGRIRNIPVQSICPAHVADHLSMGTTDPIGWAVALDAINHPGPADPSRIDPSVVCTDATMPAVNPLLLPLNEARLGGTIATTLATYPHTSGEPRLEPYARAD
jgi:pimeloyl-ACP methyl ester carboxylesterase